MTGNPVRAGSSLRVGGAPRPTPGRRRLWGWVLIGTGAVVFIQHFVSHMGFFTVISPGADDLLIGYPTAAILAFSGALMQGWLGRKRR